METRRAIAGPLVLVFATLALAAQTPPRAFAEPRRQPRRESADRAVRRARAVTLRPGLFDKAGRARVPREIRMNFFPDVDITVRWTAAEKDAAGAITWTGAVPGAPLGHAVLIFQPGTVSANVGRGDGLLYQLRTEGAVLWAREVDQSRFPRKEFARGARFHPY